MYFTALKGLCSFLREACLIKKRCLLNLYLIIYVRDIVGVLAGKCLILTVGCCGLLWGAVGCCAVLWGNIGYCGGTVGYCWVLLGVGGSGGY